MRTRAQDAAMQTDGRCDNDNGIAEQQLTDFDAHLLAVPQSVRLRVDHYANRLDDVLQRAYKVLTVDGDYNDDQQVLGPHPCTSVLSDTGPVRW